jgi:divalent metal cation (Fe/Co/Zn/Cd) transporter
MVIARNRALAVHHVTVHSIDARLSVSLDLEVDGSLPLTRAHEIADDLEAAVRDELGPEVEVETHIEPLQMSGLDGRDAADGRIAAVREELAALAANNSFVRDVHDVRVRETTEGEIVNFHATVDPALTVAEVHEKIDALERALRQRFPAIKRVIGHAEPKR